MTGIIVKVLCPQCNNWFSGPLDEMLTVVRPGGKFGVNDTRFYSFPHIICAEDFTPCLIEVIDRKEETKTTVLENIITTVKG
jgi:hypothetical protein